VIRVLACTGDAGGAEAVAPVVARLWATRDVVVEAWAYGPAVEVFARHGLAASAPRDARTAVATADAVLLGTSVGGPEHEKELAAAARDAGVPSLAVLDYWSSYDRRFGPVAPDVVAVVDERMGAELVASGFHPGRVVVTGAPQHERLLLLEPLDDGRRAELRAQAGAAAEDRLVLFASQPVREIYGGSLGFDERTVLAALGTALAHAPVGTRLVVRPHPREADPSPLPPGAVAVRDDAALDWARAADLVCGMTTALLLEAAMLGCVTLSLQPGLVGADTLRVGTPVTDPEEVEPTVHRALLDDDYRAAVRRGAPRAVPGAGARVASLVLELARAAA
jgi:hypothetical protein